MTVQYVSNVYATTGTTGGGSTGSSSPSFTVKFAEVLQDQVLLNPQGDLADEFRDRSADLAFADAAEAARQGVRMSEQSVATVTKTFTSLDDLRAFMDTAMGDLKRREIMAQHNAVETDQHKISPVLRMTLLSVQDEATKTSVTDFLSGNTRPTTVNVIADDGTVSGGSSGASSSGFTVTFTQVLQDQKLCDPLSDVAAKFADRSSDLVFADADAASAQGVAMTQKAIGQITKTFATVDELRDFMSTMMGDLKRKEVMAQSSSPETDTHKISPVLLMSVSAATADIETEVKDFLNSDDCPKTVAVVAQTSNATGTSSGSSSDSPTKIPGGITVTFAQTLQDQILLNPNSGAADAFLDPSRDLAFADAAEATDQGVQVAERIVGQITKTFSDLNELRDYLSGLMTDLKRKEVMAQHSAPENDHHKISPVIRVAFADDATDEAKTKVNDFLSGDDAPKLVTVFVQGQSQTGDDGETAPGTIAGGITVAFEQVLQGQNLIDANSPLAPSFLDPTVDLVFNSKADATAQGVSLKEQVVGKITKTFTDLDALKDYMSTLMGNLKRTEVMAQHDSPENMHFKISPLLRMSLSGASADAETQVRDFLAGPDAPATVKVRVADKASTDDTAPPGTIPGGIMISFAQVLQNQTLLDPAGDVAGQFADRAADLAFGDADEALRHGVGMSERTLASTTKIFKTTDELRDYLSQMMFDLKRKEMAAQTLSPESDSRKISPLLRMHLASGSSAAKQAVLDFLGDEDTQKLVPLLVDDGA